jgi:excisionase family DNA binding protein
VGSDKDRPALGDATPATLSTPPSLVTPVGLARHLAVSETTVRRLVDDKVIPVIRVGNLLRFDVADVRRALAERSAAAAGKAK